MKDFSGNKKTGGRIFLKSLFILFKSTDVYKSQYGKSQYEQQWRQMPPHHQSAYLGGPESTSIDIPLSDPNLLKVWVL